MALLKHCPFCGSDRARQDGEPGKVYIRCPTCSARGPERYLNPNRTDGEEKAVEVCAAWNRWHERTPP